MKFEFTLEQDELSPYLQEQLKNLKNGVPLEAEKASKKVAFDWWRRAGTGPLGAPLLTGTLRGSLSGGAQGIPIGVGAPNKTGGTGSQRIKISGNITPNREFNRPGPNRILIEVGANTDYAASVHENVAPAGDKRAQITGRGKYIEFNLRENLKKWMNLIAQGFSRSLKK